MDLTEHLVVLAVQVALAQMVKQAPSQVVKARSVHNNLPTVLNVEKAALEVKVVMVQTV
jgi:hypothetical protein